MLSKQHGCQLLQEQPLVHDELEQELQQQRELVQVLELPPLESVRERVLQLQLQLGLVQVQVQVLEL
jgi:hypothetical protein